MAGTYDEAAGAPEGAPVCPSCHQLLPDRFSTLPEGELLQEIKLGLLRVLARSLADGSASGQDISTARALLKDNGIKTDLPEDNADPNLPPHQRRALPQETRQFPKYEHDE